MGRAPSSVSAAPSHLLPQGEKGTDCEGRDGVTGRAPSSGATRHLLPQGEKGTGCEGRDKRPSPLAGEGARRADEGTRAFAKALRRNQTEAERRLWGLLRDRRLAAFKFRRQVPIGPYVADFACYGARLVVELDGSQHAGSAHDLARDTWLRRNGYRVLRVWNNDLTRNTDGVLAAIWAAVQDSVRTMQ